MNGLGSISASAGIGATLTLANNLMDGNVGSEIASRHAIRLASGVILQHKRFSGLFGTPLSNTNQKRSETIDPSTG